MAEASVISQFPTSSANLIFNNLEADTRLDSSLRVNLTLRGVTGLMLIPVSTGTTWLGALLLEAHQGQTFTGDQARLCRSVADQTALVVDSQTLFRRARESAEHEHALRDLAAALSSTLDPYHVLGLALDNIGRFLPCDAANILLIEEGVARPVAARGYGAQGVDETRLFSDVRLPVNDVSSLRQMAVTRQPLIIPDTGAYPDWVVSPETGWVRSYAAAPLAVGEEVLGFINLDSATPHAFTEAHTVLLQAITQQTAIAVKNAQLYQESRRRLDTAAAVSKITTGLQRSPSIDGVLENTVRTLQEILAGYDIAVRLTGEPQDVEMPGGGMELPGGDAEPPTGDQ
jgi:GAF domain-containing protein